jgi:acetate kinase
LDYLIFTAGIGEKSPVVRKAVCEKLGVLGIELDRNKNETCRSEMNLTGKNSKVNVLVIPTDEELGIARRTFEYSM